jgi:hypothetical protein
MQKLVVVHVTPDRPPPVGVGEIDQVVPFQDSASAEVSEYPTAMHDVRPVHEMSWRKLLFAPAGFGLGTNDHVVPFQDSTRVV